MVGSQKPGVSTKAVVDFMTPAQQTLEEAIKDVVFESGIPAKQLADAIGEGYHYLLAAANPNTERTQFQARLIIPITLRSGNDAIVRALAHGVGGFFARVEPNPTEPATLAKSMREFTDYLDASVRAAADGQHSPSEVAEIRRQGFELIEAVLGHLAGLDASDTDGRA